ncbi:hypothetical protein [Sphingomonas bacterium]|uniref:hypothetical protein n=1 Tax=Sphingomonas bacterium TaxID=1895847 RepID=UPI0015772404|nr:hypothetical protein [Sphingomonas bacterium]
MSAKIDLDNLRMLTSNIVADLDIVVADDAVDAAAAAHIRIAQAYLDPAAEELQLALATIVDRATAGSVQ